MEKDFATWGAILEFADEIWKYTAATKAYKQVTAETPDCSNNRYLKLAAEAIWEQLLLGITKIFDRARTCGNENCSIELLKELCQQSPRFHAKQKVALLKEADALCAEYEEIITREIRNKHIAHADLQKILEHQSMRVPFETVEPFVIHVAEFLSAISSPFLAHKATLVFVPLEEATREYEQILRTFLYKEPPR